MIDGYYYLHANGSLIYKKYFDGAEADFRDSDLVKAFWSCDYTDREGAWNLLVESGALGASETRITELATKWGCNDKDAAIYADRVGVDLQHVSGLWGASIKNKSTAPIGQGFTALGALSDLCAHLGYTADKLGWSHTFKSLIKSYGSTG